MKWLNDNNVDVIDWPALSPDLNRIENVWGMLARTVYDNGRQYHSFNELYHAIHHAWQNMSPGYLQKLVDSMKARCLKVLKSDGEAINY